MKLYCVVFCVYLFLVPPALCQFGLFYSSDNEGSKTPAILSGVYSGFKTITDGIYNFLSPQPETKPIDTVSLTTIQNDVNPPVEVKALNGSPPQQEEVVKNEEDKKNNVNVDTTILPSSTQPSVIQTNSARSDQIGESCTTVDNDVGSCIPFAECDPYVGLLAGLNETVISMLRKAYCGHGDPNTPKVCCPRAEPQTEKPRLPAKTLPADAAPNPGRITTYKQHFVALPEPPVCGTSNASLNRVVGGDNAKLGDFPWMAILGYKDYEGAPIKWNCGGSLITSKHVLTACHCVLRREDTLSVVRLGELDLSRDDDGAEPIDVPVRHMLKHEDYVYGGGTNDVAVLVLDREIAFTDLIRPICLPISADLRSNSFEDYNPLVAGWGKIAWEGKKAKHLQVVQLPVISNDECKEYWKFIDGSAICTSYDEGGKDACSGDSGGPLIQPIFKERDATVYFYEIGVISFGKECARPGIPGVYMRVSHYLPWILSKVVGDTSLLN